MYNLIVTDMFSVSSVPNTSLYRRVTLSNMAQTIAEIEACDNIYPVYKYVMFNSMLTLMPSKGTRQLIAAINKKNKLRPDNLVALRDDTLQFNAGEIHNVLHLYFNDNLEIACDRIRILPHRRIAKEQAGNGNIYPMLHAKMDEYPQEATQ